MDYAVAIYMYTGAMGNSLIRALPASPLYASNQSVIENRMVMGHEFIGTVIALGSNFVHGESASQTSVKIDGRPELYASLKVGDKVVSPFTISCGECQYVNHIISPIHT